MATGDPLNIQIEMMQIKKIEYATIKGRFDKKYTVSSDGCWIWSGAPSDQNYGQIRINGKTYLASRISFMLYVGDIPTGMNVCHKCDVRMCVNPKHLFLGTKLDNSRDMVRKNRSCYGERLHIAKLKSEYIPIIKEAYSAGFTQVSIGKYFSVHHNTISRIVNNLIWKRA